MDMNILKASYTQLSKEEKKDTVLDSLNDIAVIGINAKIGEAENTDEFWRMLCEGCDFIRDFPSERWNDANQLYYLKTGEEMAEMSGQGAYLSNIDGFDAGFFNIANTEADIMDPAQRLFLESAWAAIEDAGYSSQQMNGSKTGVYVGYSNLGEQYSSAVMEDSENYGIKVSGNIGSIIAARISYCMNLVGPAIVFDTACSSSLTALHVACSQLRTGEISMALVGSVREMLVPRQYGNSKIGIESSSERTKTFDGTADGTGGGEGVISILIKSLVHALEDHDNIYAVIKGSSLNQDGASVGITAPNSAAQEKVIKTAWQEAEIDPESISYLEAHGTATNLGDPVEITGIERAFQSYTDKKQFCAIGSVKTNVGHLDCAAGMAGLLKTILMLKNKKIPPIVHFKQPNRKINFISSPVYINDTLIEWKSENKPRRCGVSSFGLSGTNAHVILEEAPECVRHNDENRAYLLVMSAKSKTALNNIIKQYQKYLLENETCNMGDFCFTAATGRTPFTYRYAVIVGEKTGINKWSLKNTDNITTFYGANRVVEGAHGEGYLSVQQQRELSMQAGEILQKNGDIYAIDFLSTLAELFVKGADIDFSRIYKQEDYYRMSIPVYPFENNRHWLAIKEENVKSLITSKKEKKLHPLIDECIVNSHNIIIYESRMSLKTHWELNEHRVNGKGVLPGTAYIEMVYYACSKYFKKDKFELHDMIYLLPLSCGDGEVRIVHMVINVKDDALHIEFHSKVEGEDDDSWICNSRVKVTRYQKKEEQYYKIKEIIARCNEVEQKSDKSVTIVNIDGFHWSNNLLHGYANDEEIVLDLCLHESLREEAKAYSMLPSLLDQAISSGHHFSRSVYIPYCFTKARFYEPLPVQMYSYIKKRRNEGDFEEIATFDVVLCDMDGRVIATVDNYVIMKIHQPEFYLVTQKLTSNLFFETKWNEKVVDISFINKKLPANERVIVLYEKEKNQLRLKEELKQYYKEQAVFIESSRQCDTESDAEYVLRHQPEEYHKAIAGIKKNRIRYVIVLTGYEERKIQAMSDLESEIDSNLNTAFYFVKALVNNNIKYQLKMFFVTLNGITVNGTESCINPGNHALSGMGLSLHDEYSNIIGKTIDCDEYTSAECIINEIHSDEKMYAVAYRNNKKYVEQLETLQYSEKIFEKKLELKDYGVYLIAGGMGGMGISFCKYLISQNPHICVVLLNRTCSEEEIDSGIFADNPKIMKKVESINKLRSEGSNVHIVKADISDYAKLTTIISEIRDKYGRISGIINAAGIASDGFLINKEWDKFEGVLRPKIQGTWSLFSLTEQDKPDFFVLCSSLASVYGAPGQIDYVAANAYLDSFSFYLRKKEIQALTIDWSGWNESGMAADNAIDEESSFLHFVNDAEGAVILSYAMKLNLPRVLAGGIKYQVYAAEKKRFEEKVMLPDNVNEKVESYSENNKYEINWNNILVSGKSMEKLTDVEKDVILIWARVLGIKEVDVYDKFFEVGGNSLLASTFQKNIDEKYPNILSIMDIFTYSTIENIAAFISSKTTGEEKMMKIEDVVEKSDESGTDIEELLDRFLDGGLNMDEVDNLLKQV